MNSDLTESATKNQNSISKRLSLRLTLLKQTQRQAKSVSIF